MLLLMSQPAGSTGGQCRYGSLGALAHFLLGFSFWSKLTVWCLSLLISVVFGWDERKEEVNKPEGKPIEI